MRLLRLTTLGMIAAAIVAPALARAADADPRVAQLVAASGQALGISSIASASTMRADMNISAAGLTAPRRSGSTCATGALPNRQTSRRSSRKTGTMAASPGAATTHISSGTPAAIVIAPRRSIKPTSPATALWRPQLGGAAVAGSARKRQAAPYDVLSITPRDSLVPFELWFDRTTHLPARALFVNGFTTSTLDFLRLSPQ